MPVCWFAGAPGAPALRAGHTGASSRRESAQFNSVLFVTATPCLLPIALSAEDSPRAAVRTAARVFSSRRRRHENTSRDTCAGRLETICVSVQSCAASLMNSSYSTTTKGISLSHVVVHLEEVSPRVLANRRVVWELLGGCRGDKCPQDTQNGAGGRQCGLRAGGPVWLI